MARRAWHRPTPLTSRHVLTGFAYGKPELDEWLLNRALANQMSGATKTHLVEADGRIVGYFALSSIGVAHRNVKGKAKRKMPDPIPAVLLARFAVDQKYQGLGLGAAIPDLNDQLTRSRDHSWGAHVISRRTTGRWGTWSSLTPGWAPTSPM